jgi:deazaflavin-dependent oxidoreductase (nitroreductase family)
MIRGAVESPPASIQATLTRLSRAHTLANSTIGQDSRVRDEPADPKNSKANILQVMDDHIRRYLETDGEDGHIFQGLPCLLLTTRGRRTGEPRQVAIIYGRNDEDYVVVASMGGSDVHPGWYKNLLADPEAQIQVKADRMKVRARTAPAEERRALWEMMAAIYPSYDEYQAATKREIPIALLEVID